MDRKYKNGKKSEDGLRDSKEENNKIKINLLKKYRQENTVKLTSD